MNLSEKDTKILAFVLIVILIGVYYFIPYKHLQAQKKDLNNEISSLNSTYNQLSQDILKKDEYVKGIDEAQTKIEELYKELPADLPQDFIIYTLNNIRETIGIKFPNISISPVEAVTTLNDDNTKPGQETAIKCKVTTSTVLNYSQLKALMTYLYGTGDSNEVKQRIVLNDLQLTSTDKDTDELNASFSLSFYGIQSEDRTLDPFDLGNFDMHKSNVFTPYEGYGSSVSSYGQTQDEKADFFIVLDPITADNTSVVIGQNMTNDGSKFVHADENAFVNVEISIDEKNGQYFYRYKAGNESYPGNYTNGVAFDPGTALELKVISSRRTSQDDNSGANATIINNSDMPLNVIYFSEDQAYPRLNITKVVGDVVIH